MMEKGGPFGARPVSYGASRGYRARRFNARIGGSRAHSEVNIPVTVTLRSGIGKRYPDKARSFYRVAI